MRAVDADEARAYINEIIPQITESDYQKGIAVGLTMAKIALKASIVDAVPVVRCKDCKYNSALVDGCKDPLTYCRKNWINIGLNGDWFCADGESTMGQAKGVTE